MTKHGGREHRVREIAYLLWERDGYPHGESDRHWFEAELLYDVEVGDSEPPENAAKKKASAPPKAKAAAPAKSEARAESAPPEKAAAAKAADAKPAAKTKVAAKRADTSGEQASAKAPAAPKRKA